MDSSMKVTARISESGQQVDAADDADWAVVHPQQGRGPILFCPERVCDNRVVAVERERKDGRMTRHFRFHHTSPRCTHAKVTDPVVVDPAPAAAHGGESPEHLWLKEWVHQAARRAGYPAVVLERALNPQVRADVFVPEAVRGRVEIQRGATDLPRRTADYPDVVWLLRAADDASNTRYLFSAPCVQVRVVRLGRAAQPWDDGLEASVRATSTVLTPRAEPDPTQPHGFFETEKRVALDDFLRDVWSGRRRWYPVGEAHKFAGWVMVEDHERYLRWKQQQSEPVPAVAPDVVAEVPVAAPEAPEEVVDIGPAPVAEDRPPDSSTAPFTSPVAPQVERTEASRPWPDGEQAKKLSLWQRLWRAIVGR